MAIKVGCRDRAPACPDLRVAFCLHPCLLSPFDHGAQKGQEAAVYRSGPLPLDTYLCMHSRAIAAQLVF